MLKVKSDAGSSQHDEAHSIWGVVRHYFLTELPSAVLVAALVFILHHQDWLKAIDSYAFLLIGHQSFVKEIKAGTPHRVVVFAIDQETFETRYREQSPLSRCELYKDLKFLYDAKPDIVAIDIDLSPVASNTEVSTALTQSNSPRPDRDSNGEFACQYKLDQMIMDRKANQKIHTVIMEPFSVSQNALGLKKTKEDWKRKMQSAGIAFGDAQVRVKYGLVFEQDKRQNTFAAQARVATFDRRPLPHILQEKKHAHIDPRRYAEIEVVFTSYLDKNTSKIPTEHLSSLLNSTQKSWPLDNSFRVAFFGGTYGEGDSFLTPIGLLPGVEIQAAAYLTQGLTKHDFRSLGGDILVAIIFGTLIAVCWQRYFTWRVGSNAVFRQLAPAWIIVLMVAVVLMTWLTLELSLLLLSEYSAWISPVPIAIGMLLDSFVSGTVDQATSKMRIQKTSWLSELEEAVPLPRDSRLSDFLAKEHENQPVPPKDCKESFRRMIGGDIFTLIRSGKSIAARLLLFWTIVWIVVVVLAVWMSIWH